MERPIIFSGPMVRAILEGHKTQTRRICKGARRLSCAMDWPIASCPYGQRSDLLWVRETWRTDPARDGLKPREIPKGAPILTMADTGLAFPSPLWGKVRPAIFMPRWASRLTLELTAERVERLQEISKEDAVSEGLVVVNNGYRLNGYGLPDWEQHECRFSPIDAYQRLWDSITAKWVPWASNPFVWVITFERVKP